MSVSVTNEGTEHRQDAAGCESFESRLEFRGDAARANFAPLEITTAGLGTSMSRQYGSSQTHGSNEMLRERQPCSVGTRARALDSLDVVEEFAQREARGLDPGRQRLGSEHVGRYPAGCVVHSRAEGVAAGQVRLSWCTCA